MAAEPMSVLDSHHDGGGMEILTAYVREELAQALRDPKEELDRIDEELQALKDESGRLLSNLTEVNREFIDERLVEIKRRRSELQNRRESAVVAAGRDVDLDAATQAAMG